MIELGRAMHAESRYNRVSFNAEKVNQLFQSLIAHPQGIVLVTEHGMLFGFVTDYWFGDDLFAAEYVLYVDPEYRKRGEAVALVREYVRLARELGAKEIHIENTTGVEIEKTCEFFLRMGFGFVGGNFVMEV